MIVDSIGLLIIAICTSMEGQEDWHAHLSSFVSQNPDSILCWFAGLCSAVCGLLLVTGNAISLESLPHIEHLGMGMITIAPVINAIGWISLETGSLNLGSMWLNTEFVEFCGMNLLNLSYFTKDSTYILLCECSGYFVLSLAALLDISFTDFSFLPHILIRRDYVHVMDAVGLFLLALVSVGKHSIESCSGSYRGCRFKCPNFANKKKASTIEFDVEIGDKQG
jgi:hypothetical protein